MKWFFSKKKVQDEKREVQVLERREEQIQRDEIRYVEEAMREFTQARGRIDRLTINQNALVNPEKASLDAALRLLNSVQSLLLNARMKNRAIKKLATQLESDLVDIRDGTHDNRAAVLSADELNILTFGKEIERNIDSLVARLKELAENISAKNGALLGNVRSEETSLNLGLQGLHTKLVHLYELEKKVEELTAAWVA